MSDRAFLNWPFFDDEQTSLAVRLDDWIASNGDLLSEHPGDNAALDSHCRKLVKALGEAGLLQNCVPKDPGESSISVRNLSLSRETLSYESGLADFCFAMQGLGSGPISLFGNEELRKRYLPDVASGKSIAAFAISEPEAGSDVGAIKTTATRNRGDFLLNGTKTWISNAGIADHYVVFARTDEAPATRGLSAFVVDADAPGLSVSERIQVSAPHPLGTLQFEHCRVPSANMVSGPGDGFRVAMGTLDVFRTTVGAAALGFAKRAFDEAVARSKEREAFGKHLSDFQITQAKIADMAVSIDAAALLIYRAAWLKDRAPEKRITRQAAMAKLYATEQAQKVIDQAVQLFGGLGVVTGNVVESLYREVRSLRIYEGTSEIQQLIIAADVMKGVNDAE
jgi:acyl-CoA dehydrogenase